MSGPHTNQGNGQRTVLFYRRKYERRERMTIWVGAGLAGLIVLVSGDLGARVLFKEVPGMGIIRATLLTLLVIAGGALAIARVNFEYGVTKIERRKVDEGLSDNAIMPNGLKASWAADPMWVLSLVTITLAGMSFVTAAWWAWWAL